MFTGIVEEIGYIKTFAKHSNGAEIEILCNNVLQGTKIGDSISINGVCETVVDITEHSFKAKISEETLNVSTFSDLKVSQAVNLERALTLNSRLGGHIVSGHVDCKGRLVEIEKLSDFYNLTFEIPQEQAKYIVYKGSIAINGVSLTVANEISPNDYNNAHCIVKIAIIPHTYQNTTLKNLVKGALVNVETDILGRYVEKMLSLKDNKVDKISMEFLSENGFV